MTELRDARRAPFFYVTVAASSVLRGSFVGKRLTTARAIYDALAEVANEARSSEFTATRRRLARYAGVSDRTVDAYAGVFAELGLLEVERRRDRGANLPNVWRLVEPPAVGGGEAASPGWRSQQHHPGEANRTRGGEANNTLLKKEAQEEKKVVPLKDRVVQRRDPSRFERAMRRC